MSPVEATNIALGGLATGAIYGLLGISYDVIFATTGVLNFAQADLMMVGAMLAAGFGIGLGWPYLGVFFVVVAAGFVVGALEERFAVRPATSKGQGSFGWALSTLGVSVILESAFGLAMSENVRSVPHLASTAPLSNTSILIIPQNIVLIGASLLVALILATAYGRTTIGKALSAMEQDHYGAQLRGIPVSAYATLSFAVGAGIASLTGLLAGPLTDAYPTMGASFALYGFIAAALGGIPNIWGALVGGWLLGIASEFIGYAVGASYQVPVVFVLLLAVLAIRPHGLFGVGTVREV